MRTNTFIILLSFYVLCASTLRSPPHANNGGESSRGDRFKRQSIEQYYLDILVVVDFASFNSWYQRTSVTDTQQVRKDTALLNLKKYFTLVMDEVSALYRPAAQDFGFRLNFRPVGFFIETQNTSLWTRTSFSQQVNTVQTLSTLKSWLTIQTGLPSYDHVLLFTGKDLATDSDGHTSGRGSVGTMCKTPSHNSVSVIEDGGAFQSVFTIAHELGHSLNALHDGTANNCSVASRYIMAASSGTQTDTNKRQPWFFSTCSVAEIRSYIVSLSTSEVDGCLKNALPQDTDVPDVTRVIPGQLYNQDTQCKHLYGSTSSYCFFGNLETICTTMPCRDPTSSQRLICLNRVAATGTTCGDKKWCQAGECVRSSEAPVLSNCVKDQTTLVNGMTCQQMSKVQPVLCYDSQVFNTCCSSCQNVNTKVAGCPYGDRKTGCTPDICRQITSAGDILDEDCCGTCNFDNSTWTCSDVSRLDGATCPEAVARRGVQGCYNATVAFHCCATCRSKRLQNAESGCEYGDLLLQGCPATPGSNCDNIACCRSCTKDPTGGSGTKHTHISTLLTLVVLALLA